MELTTHQIYALFGMLAFMALLGFIAYRAGLTTGNACGYQLGRTTAAKHWRSLIAAMREEHTGTARKLDAREREIQTLRRNIQTEAEDHAKVEEGLLQRLAAAAPLSDEDQATLEAIASKLDLAADTWAGLQCGDHARYARQLGAHALNMAHRIKTALANTLPHPDSELIDWLHEEAHFFCDGEHGEFRFQLLGDIDSDAHARALLRQAKADSEEIDRNHTEALEAAA